jgi:all-trans-8'-apo-beta-carotenal 15,15'-oxygenase
MGDDIIADFIAYDTPDHFIPHDAFFYRIMQGETGKAHAPGKLRRYRMNRTTGRLREEIVDAGTHEFPLVDPRVVTRKHQVGFMAAGGLRGITSAIKRVDFDSGHSSVFDFGPMAATGEPVFVAKPGGTTNQGWLITQVLDGTTKTTFFAIFDAMAVEHGPVAKIWLSHHLPISFHGWWHAA